MSPLRGTSPGARGHLCSCEIHWKAGKDLTHATVKKKGKGGKKGKTVTKVEAVPSFFRFFESLEFDEAKAAEMEQDEVMAVSSPPAALPPRRRRPPTAPAPVVSCRCTSRCRRRRTWALHSRTRSSPTQSTGSPARCGGAAVL